MSVDEGSEVTNGIGLESPAVGVSGTKPLGMGERASGEGLEGEHEDFSSTAEGGFQTQTMLSDGEESSQIDASVSEPNETKVVMIVLIVVEKVVWREVD